jgi:predicted dehydrogenase
LEQVSHMKTIKTAVAGLGFIGPAHVEALRRIPGIDVVAISDISQEIVKKKAEELGVKHYYDHFEDMINHPELDCVHICTPNNLHYPMAKEALKQGLHVVCEKPLAMTINEAVYLTELAEKTGLVHAVHFNIRYYPLIRQMRSVRLNGELGEIHSIIGSYLQDWLFYVTDYNWRLEADKSGESKAIADIGSHLMDLIEYITGLRITEVMADFSTIHKTRKKPLKPVETYSGKLLKPSDYEDVPINTEDYASVLLRFDNGNKGVITVSQVSAGRKNRLSLEVAGSKQTFSWNSENPNALWIGKRDSANEVLLRDPSLVSDDSRKLIAFPGGHNEGFPDTSKQIFKEIYHDIRNGRSSNPTYPTFNDGLRELKLCEKIIESNKKQAWVTV